MLTKTNDMLNKNSLGLLKKGAAKQSRIKSIAWHLRWHVRTRADISLRPSGLVRPRTDIKLITFNVPEEIFLLFIKFFGVILAECL